MTGRKLLIDTNVFIGLEDQKEVAPEFAKMLELCQQHGVRYFVHEAAIWDIKRDRNCNRQKVSLSKVKKFEQLRGIKPPATNVLEAHFGPIQKENDVVDVELLHALDMGAVDFLVSQDQGIHARARRSTPPLADRVLRVADAVIWFLPLDVRQATPVNLPLIEEQPAHAIPLDDEIFDSLRTGYPEFNKWWREQCVNQHRLCWKATINGELAGLIVRKDEAHAEAKTRHTGPKILKVCTFKVKPEFRGEKLGELLLKQ